MSGYGRYYRPALKNSVDVQLQTSFNEGLWPSVVRLAAQRYKANRDPYYEAIRICAESQMDTVAEKSGVVLAVDALVKDKAAVPDIDAIDLYEWALHESGLPFDFSQTIGVLRARWAKANPTDPGVVDCLEACVLSWDLVNAQQIAATLDKGQPNANDGKHMFWNVTLTHLLSISPQCPENMVAMFGKLSRLQLEKAASASSAPPAANGKSQGRALKGEEEINLYYRIAGLDAYVKSATTDSGSIGVVQQFKQGRKHLLVESLRAFEKAGDWENVYKTCLHALSHKDDDGKPSFLALDTRTWKLFVKSASMKSDVEGAFVEIQEVLHGFLFVEGGGAPMYRKILGLALLELTFRSPPSLVPSSGFAPGTPSPRVIQLYLFIDQGLLQRSTFDDVKEYVGELTFEEARYFVDNLMTLAGNESDGPRDLVARILQTKFRYLLTTCPSTLEHVTVVGEAQDPQVKCRFCATVSTKNCKTCLEDIASVALSTYKDAEGAADSLTGLDKDPRIDLALVACSALLKLSGLRQGRSLGRLRPLGSVDVSRLLQAVVVLSTQVSKTPNEIPLRLLLVQVYLLMGCASLAYQTWVPMDVKRTIQDALSPLFFDRISTISPGLFQQSRHPLTESLTSYYSGCLRESSPVKIWDAFAAGSYTSILDMAEYSDRLRRSCTLVMAVTEERRAMRAYGGRLNGDIEQSPLLAHVTDDTTFVNVTDYGSFPNLESAYALPLSRLVQYGPELSSERCRLALLAEQFMDAVNYKPPRDYKPIKANEAAIKDKAYLVDTFARLHEQSTATLLNPSATAASKLTGAEHKYYTSISLLASLLRIALETPKSSASAPPSLSTAGAGIKSALDALLTALLSTPPRLRALPMGGDVLHSLANPHTLSLLRETALAAKQAATFLVVHNAAEGARDRTGRTSLHKDVVAEARALDEAATMTLAVAKERVRGLKEALGQGGWLDRIAAWMFGEGEAAEDGLGGLVRDVVGEAEIEEWAGRVVESWREGVKGFGMVRME